MPSGAPFYVPVQSNTTKNQRPTGVAWCLVRQDSQPNEEFAEDVARPNTIMLVRRYTYTEITRA